MESTCWYTRNEARKRQKVIREARDIVNKRRSCDFYAVSEVFSGDRGRGVGFRHFGVAVGNQVVSLEFRKRRGRRDTDIVLDVTAGIQNWEPVSSSSDKYFVGITHLPPELVLRIGAPTLRLNISSCCQQSL